VTAATLAQSLEVSERTIYRDMAELATQGAPIEGEAGVGYILRPGLFLPPLMLGEEETEAVILGLRYVDQRGDEVLKKAAADALAKIGAVLSPGAQAILSMPISIPGPDGTGFPENIVSLVELRAAIRVRRRLDIAYVDDQRKRTQRVVWPFQLGFMDNARVLAAWCEMRAAFRFFRTDRILSAVVGEHYPARRADLLRDCRRQLDTDKKES
jgi:predicted DNA-binding transcriptional regulator YafY